MGPALIIAALKISTLMLSDPALKAYKERHGDCSRSPEGNRRIVTVEAFEQMLPTAGRRYELDRGEVVELTFPNPWHNLVAGVLYQSMEAFVRERKLGTAFFARYGVHPLHRSAHSAGS